MMKFGTICSTLLHLCIIFLAFFGLPSPKKSNSIDTPISIEILPIDKETQAPHPMLMAEPITEALQEPLVKIKKSTQTPTPPVPQTNDSPLEPKNLVDPMIEETSSSVDNSRPDQTKHTDTTTPPIEKSEPLKTEPLDLNDALPPLHPKVVPEKLPLQKQEIKKQAVVEPKVEAPKPLAPKNPPKPPSIPKKKLDKKKPQNKKMSFESILKNIAKTQPSSTASENVEDIDDTVTASPQVGKMGDKLTMSEHDALKNHISKFWVINAGARDLNHMHVIINIQVNPDRTIKSFKPVIDPTLSANPSYQTLVESAIRALRDPRCSPLDLPSNKYEEWKEINFNFDPRDMLR